jgi:hypothetical protein
MYFISDIRNNNTFAVNGAISTIPNGSYNYSELIILLNSTSINIDFTFNSSTKLVTMTNTSVAQATVAFFDTNTVYDSLGTILGFTGNTNTIAAAQSQTATNAMIFPTDKYFFLRLNELGNIININKRYVAKIIVDVSADGTNFILLANTINLDQPQDINGLKVSLEDTFGNNINLNGNNFSFSFELNIITNAILKDYDQIKFYSEPVMQRLLNAKMLTYYQKQIDGDSNNTFTGTYNSNLVNLNNVMEYNPYGNSNNYSLSNNSISNNSSYFNNMNKK